MCVARRSVSWTFAWLVVVSGLARSASAATYVVNSTLDDGSNGTLRWAITQAEANAGADVIDLTGVSGTITLTSALPSITEDLDLNGPGSATLTITGNDLYRIFFINAMGAVITINDLTLAHGKGVGRTGGTGGSNGGGGGGGLGAGGGVFLNDGDLTVRRCKFDTCSAAGGNGAGFSAGVGSNCGGGGAGFGANGSNGSGVTGGSGGSGGVLGAGSDGGNGGTNSGNATAGGWGAGGGGGGGGATNGATGGYGGGGGGGSVSASGQAAGGTFGGSGNGSAGAGGGGAGLGGAAFLRNGTVLFHACVFTANSATRGNGGAGGAQGKAGAIFVDAATVYSASSTFTSNSAQTDTNSATDNDNYYGTITFYPVVSSAVRVSATPTNSASVQFTVTIASSVTGVDATDFALTTTGTISGASITGVSGSGTTYTVTVNTGSGNGNIQLDLVDDNTIVDSGMRQLGGPDLNDGDFSGQAYTFDRVAPTVQTVAVHDGTSVDVTLADSNAIGSGATTTTNYVISGTGIGSLSAHPDSVALVSGTTYRLTWNTGEMFGGGDVTITVANVADSVGNAISTETGTDVGGAVAVQPTVASANVINTSSVDVEFSEALGSGGTTAANYTISGAGQGTLSAHPDSVAFLSGTTYRLTWLSGHMSSGSDVTITVTGVSDAAGNPIGSPNSALDAGAGIAVYPTVTTDAASSTATTSATCGGNVSDDGGATVTARGVCWNTTGAATIADSKTSDGAGNGAFVSNLTGLTRGTTYYVRAYATSALATSYGNEVTVTTTAEAPTVTTAMANEITSSSAVCGGAITDDGGAPVTTRGVCWNSTGDPTLADNVRTEGAGVGEFSSELTGLNPDSTYYVRAYATNVTGTTYGETKTFTTSSAPAPEPTTPEETPVPEETPTPVDDVPELRVEVEALQDTVLVGHTLSFRIRVTNISDSDAELLQVMATIPDNVEFVDALLISDQTAQALEPDVEVVGNEVTLTITSLSAGESLSVELIVRPKARGTVAIAADASSANGAVAETDGTSTAGETTVSAEAEDEVITIRSTSFPLCGGIGFLPMTLFLAFVSIDRLQRTRRRVFSRASGKE